ncbi:MAG: tetratricopeptide repeat protein [Reinekea sp.]
MSENEQAMEHARIERVDTLLDLKRPEQAMQAVIEGLAAFPQSYYLHFLKARIHLQMKDFVEADKAICATINIDLNNGHGFFLRSLILHNLLNFTGELEMALQAVRLEPENEHFLGRLVEAHLQSGEYRKAREVSEQLIKLDPGSAESHEQLARICFLMEDWAKAEKSLRNALAIRPNWLHLHQFLASTLRRQKRLDEAIEVLYIAIKQEPTNTALLDSLDNALQGLLPSPWRVKAHTNAVEQLPEHLKYFYQDRHSRRSWYQKNAMLVHIGFWVSSLAIIALIYTALTP